MHSGNESASVRVDRNGRNILSIESQEMQYWLSGDIQVSARLWLRGPWSAYQLLASEMCRQQSGPRV